MQDVALIDEVGNLVDHHRDMRLDIEDMSYEVSIQRLVLYFLVNEDICVIEVVDNLWIIYTWNSWQDLLALGERIGNVSTGLSEETITNQLKTKSYSSSATGINLEEEACDDQETDSCIICQVWTFRNRFHEYMSCTNESPLTNWSVYFTGRIQEPGEDWSSSMWAWIPCGLLKEMVGCEKCLPHMQIRGFDSWKEGCIEKQWNRTSFSSFLVP